MRDLINKLLNVTRIGDLRNTHQSIRGSRSPARRIRTEVLTGVPAGVRRGRDGYARGTVHEKVEQRLAEMTQTLRDLARAQDGEAGLMRQPTGAAAGLC